MVNIKRRRKKMWNRVRYMVDRFLPVSKVRYINDMHAILKVLDGMKEGMTQQAEITSNLLSKFSEEEAKKKPTEKDEKQINDMAFG